MSFPLFTVPGSVVFLDDDPDYLDMLRLLVPADWSARFYLDPQHCLRQILNNHLPMHGRLLCCPIILNTAS